MYSVFSTALSASDGVFAALDSGVEVDLRSAACPREVRCDGADRLIAPFGEMYGIVKIVEGVFVPVYGSTQTMRKGCERFASSKLTKRALDLYLMAEEPEPCLFSSGSHRDA